MTGAPAADAASEKSAAPPRSVLLVVTRRIGDVLLAAGRRSLGLQPSEGRRTWDGRFLDHSVPFDNLNTHTVRMHLALADALGIPRCAEVVAAWSAGEARQVDAPLGASGSR